jgi:hypothetical protein
MDQRPALHCTATTKAGRPCRAHAVKGSDPPRCHAHGGAAQTSPIAERAPADLAGRIGDLDRKIEDLSCYIQLRLQQTDGLSAYQYAALLNLYGQLVSRLGRLMRDQRALSGKAADGIAGAIAQALDELSTELGADL